MTKENSPQNFEKLVGNQGNIGDQQKKELEGRNLDNGFEKIELADKLSLEDISILLTNPELKSRIEAAFELYNEQVETNTSAKVISRYYNAVDKLRLEFESYKKDFKEKTLNPAKKKEEGVKPEERQESLPEASLLTYDLDEDYGEITDDKDFDKWIKKMDALLRINRVDISSETKDIKDWHKEYQETIPYIQKLMTVLAEVKRTTKDNIELLAAEDKIEDLIYKIHTEGETAKLEIDKIFSSYTKQKEDEAKIESLKKTKELRDAIEESKNKGGKSARKITSEQVKQILESRGEKNTAENLNELTNFLEDLQENYDFYLSGTKEGQNNNVRHAYEKYRRVGRKNIEPTKVKGLGKLLSSVGAFFTKNLDNQDKYNHFIDMIRVVRAFDLVDRKDGNKAKVEQNKKKMSELIEFCRVNADTLDKYITNNNNINPGEFEAFKNDANKLFETALSLYNTFTVGKYRTPEAKAKAEKILAEDSGFDESSFTSTPTIEMLYSITPSERKMFETSAMISVNKKALVAINSEIEALTKTKTKKEKSVLENLQKKLVNIKNVLEKIGSNEDKELVKTTELKLSVLTLKNINTENFKELSDSFLTYEHILSSNQMTKEEKTEYINSLLKNLKKIRVNKENTMVQNVRLDAIIEKYQKELKSIK